MIPKVARPAPSLGLCVMATVVSLLLMPPSVRASGSALMPAVRIGHLEGWEVAVQDVDGDGIEEVAVWDRWRKTTYRYRWRHNSFDLVAKERGYKPYAWEEWPPPARLTAERGVAIPASARAQLPSGSLVASKIETDIDGDGSAELLTLSGQFLPTLKLLSNVHLAIFERGVAPSDKFYLKLLIELSSTSNLIEGGNSIDPGSIRVCRLKGDGSEQVVVFWTKVFGSGHSTVCDVFDVAADSRLEEAWPQETGVE